MAGDNVVGGDQLRLFVERIERMHQECEDLAADIRDTFAEARANGFDTKALRYIVRLRKMETHTRQEWDAVVETYRQAIGLA